jgi:hypothetical protein
MTEISELFPTTYEASRQHFRQNLSLVRARWPDAQLSSHILSIDSNLTIDWIHSPATMRNERVFMLTTGEHGVEGYVGSAMLQRFIERHLPGLDPENTGLLLLHVINPWGMVQHRRVNANNVDLNRNFVWQVGDFDPGFNPDYNRVRDFLNPKGTIRSMLGSNLSFYTHLVWLLLRLGMARFRSATLQGQYRHQKCLYYGGTEHQEETRLLIGLYHQCFQQYERILHLDMHTGYGPRYQMSLVNSAYERGSSEEFSKRFNYPLVVAANPEEFYSMRGDMVDYVYTMAQQEYPKKQFYSGAFEFGTLGDSLFGIVHSPRAMIHENRLYWHGASNDAIRIRVKHEFEELFNPGAQDWKAKAIADADQAFMGILKGEGYID